MHGFEFNGNTFGALKYALFLLGKSHMPKIFIDWNSPMIFIGARILTALLYIFSKSLTSLIIVNYLRRSVIMVYVWENTIYVYVDATWNEVALVVSFFDNLYHIHFHWSFIHWSLKASWAVVVILMNNFLKTIRF